jgi:DNA polymerase elongation subunit (family B)
MGQNETKRGNVNIFLDIETIPQQPETAAKIGIAKTIDAPKTMSKPETIQEWHSGQGKYAGVKAAAIEKAYRDTSFDGAKGEIISIALATDEGSVAGYSRALDSDEARLLNMAFDTIGDHLDKYNLKQQAGSLRGINQPYFIGHYVAGFDLKFLWQRAVILGIKPPFKLPFDGKHGKDYYCTMQAWAGFRERISQDNLCRALGIEGKPDDIDGSKVWDFVKAGNIDRVAEYNRDDVAKVRQIYKRLTFNY